jgi:hypothetical protein
LLLAYFAFLKTDELWNFALNFALCRKGIKDLKGGAEKWKIKNKRNKIK